MPVFLGSVLPDILQGSVLADTLDGLAADDVLYGFDGADRMIGGAGDDVLFAGSGDDTIDAGAGEDIIYGQSGNDLLSYASATAAVVLVLGDPAASGGDAAGDAFSSIERFLLSAQDDSFVGSALNDRVDGGAGNDLLRGMDGSDLLQGGAGSDSLCGGLGADTLDGGAGQDFASYAESVDNLRIDFLDFATSSPEVAGDVFLSIEGYVLGFGHDIAIAAAATAFRGGMGDDSLQGSAGADWLQGDQGQDVLTGGGGSDRLHAGDEDDPVAVIDLNAAALGGVLFGGAGQDTLTGSNIADSLSGDAGNDSLSGGLGQDWLAGGSGTDSLSGDEGNDSLSGGMGADVLTGGIGTDTAVYAGAVTFVAADRTLSTGEAQGDVLTGIECLVFQGAGSSYVGAGGAMMLVLQAASGVFRAGLGAETVTGNGADSRADYAAAARALTFAADTAGVAGTAGHAAGDVLHGIATLVMGGFADRITLAGSAGGLARVEGGAGADVFTLTGAQAALFGGLGNDSFRGTTEGGTMAAPINLSGDEGADIFQIGAQNGAPSDWIALDGGAGNDKITVQNAGGAQIAGTVQATGGDGHDMMTLRAGRVLADGGAGNDTISATGWGMDLGGGDGDDRLTLTLVSGVQAGSTLAGGAGDDVLAATARIGLADPMDRVSILTFNGGSGNDQITGTAPLLAPASGAVLLREVFLFSPGDGLDSVTGFDDGTDRIAFGPGGPTSMASLVITEGPLGALIAWGAGDVISLLGVAPPDLSAADFLFA